MNLPKKHTYLLTLCALTISFGCETNPPSTSTPDQSLEKSAAITYTIDLGNSQDYADFSGYFEVTKYEFPQSNFGEIYAAIPLSDERLLINERWNNRITLLQRGKILWQRSAGEGPEDFNRYHYIYYDKKADEIIVSEDFRQVFYSTSGEYLRASKAEVTYNDMAIQGNTNWYNSNGHDNSHVGKDKSAKHELFSFTGGEGKGFLPAPVNASQAIPFTDKANFFSVDTMRLFFNQDFHDTVYQLDPLGQLIAPHHVINFKDRSSTQQILANENPPSAARYVAAEELPYIKFSTPLADNVHLTTFYSGKEYRIFLKDHDEVMNAKKLLIDGELYNVPYLHDNGTFGYTTTKSGHEILQDLLQPTTTYAQWLDQHKVWQANRNDDEPVLLIILSPK